MPVHDIGTHALLANRRTAALLDPEGNVAWLCWPRVDSSPCLLRLLDLERGGHWQVRPADVNARMVAREYCRGSLVLRTRWAVGTAVLEVEDALVAEGALVRRLRALGGRLDVDVTFSPRRDWGRRAAALRIEGSSVVAAGDTEDVRMDGAVNWEIGSAGAVGRATVDPAAPLVLQLTSFSIADPGAALDAAIAGGERLAARITCEPSDAAISCLGRGVVDELIERSAAVLVGLSHRGGGIVAAPTTSIPQWPGSSRTWDYRYSWLRDTALAGLALVRLGLHAEAAELGAFLGEVAQTPTPPSLVRVDGTPPPAETEVTDLAGFGGARPVRVGNAAAGQPQLDVVGEVIELATALAAAGTLPAPLARAVAHLADWAAAHWHLPDHGIWEIRGQPQQYTHSRLMAWAGLRDAIELARSGLVAADAGEWERARDAIAASIVPIDGMLTLHSQGGGPDAGLALIPLVGFLPHDHPLIERTLDAITRRLSHRGLIDRYEGQPDELGDPCAPFLFPTFWVTAALETCGRDGRPHFAAAANARGALGLFGEVADPQSGRPLGNFPQVQSHAAFVLAATAVPQVTTANDQVRVQG